jgi:hypothetical protein
MPGSLLALQAPVDHLPQSHLPKRSSAPTTAAVLAANATLPKQVDIQMLKSSAPKVYQLG